MTCTEIPLGVLFSTTGPYRKMSQTLLNGALLACNEINGDARSGVHFSPMIIDPKGELPLYAAGAQLMFGQGVRHVVGCYTSSSRKEVIPLFEKADALLWYPTYYEGFEGSTNVIYNGAGPSHHLSPLIGFLCANLGRKVYCIGSNYVWGWENSRVLREKIFRRGGKIAGERYYALYDTDFSASIAEIFRTEPDFIYNTLVGESCYAFYRAFRRACQDRHIDQPSRFPIATCNLSEPELEEIGADAADGHISSCSYFSSIKSERNARFVAAYRQAYPDNPLTCSEAEAAYSAVHLLAKSVKAAKSTDVASVKEQAPLQYFDAPSGRITIDPNTFHASLQPRIGRSRADFQFDILVEAPASVRADPYLIYSASTTEIQKSPPKAATGQNTKKFRLVQNFRSRRALILAPESRLIASLPLTLAKLGIAVEIIRSNMNELYCLPENLDPDRDILFIDGDNAFPFEWPDAPLPPAPVIGLVGIEAPNRLKALMQLGSTAFLSKPVYGGAVFSALSLAVNGFNQKRSTLTLIEDLTSKRKKRASVIKAVILIMEEQRLNDDEAYAKLRRQSMEERLSIEDYSEKIVNLRGDYKLKDRTENSALTA